MNRCSFSLSHNNSNDTAHSFVNIPLATFLHRKIFLVLPFGTFFRFHNFVLSLIFHQLRCKNYLFTTRLQSVGALFYDYLIFHTTSLYFLYSMCSNTIDECDI